MPDLLETIKIATDDLKQRIMLMVSRGTISMVNDAKKMQLVQVSILKNETKDDVERFQNFGFTSVPPLGSEAICLSISGNRDHMVIVAVDDRRVRPTGLNAGESAMYNAFASIAKLTNADVFDIAIKKLKIDNGSDEFVSVLVELLEKLIASKNITGIGPQPFTLATIADLTAIKEKLEGFKV